MTIIPAPSQIIERQIDGAWVADPHGWTFLDGKAEIERLTADGVTARMRPRPAFEVITRCA